MVDWSPSNILAVGLSGSVYLWNAGTGNIDHLLDLEASDYVCSLSWIQEGSILAVGTSTGSVQVTAVFCAGVGVKKNLFNRSAPPLLPSNYHLGTYFK